MKRLTPGNSIPVFRDESCQILLSQRFGILTMISTEPSPSHVELSFCSNAVLRLQILNVWISLRSFPVEEQTFNGALRNGSCSVLKSDVSYNSPISIY